MKIRMFLAAIVTLFGFVSHATVVSTVVWTNNLDTVQNGYSITLGEGCIISDGAAVIGSSGGISIDLDNRPAAVSVLIKYSNCQPQSNSAIAISTYIQSTSGSSTHELGVRSNGGNTRNVTGYWQSGPNYSFGDVTLPESGYMLFSTSASVGTKVYAGFEISSLAGGENSTLHFSNTGVGRIMIGAATGTQSSVPYFSWNGLVIEQIAVFENCYLSSADVVNFDFATGKVVPVPTFTVENGVLTKVALNGATEVVIPEEVSSIGANAFYNCIELASVTIPNSVTNIGSFAFQNCMRLSKVSLPESIVSVGECSFAKGTAVETFEVSENNPVYKALNGLLCTKDGTVVVACPTGLKEVVVPQGVREIARFAFEYCSVTNVTLPEGLEVIGFYGMGHCDALKSVTLPASLISVDDTSFAYDYELESIDVAAGSESFRSEDGILYDKAMTQLICVPPAYGDPVLIVPDGVTTIRSLESCKNIESVIMPNSVIALKSWAFDNCSSLTNIVLSQSLTEISHCAFRFCYALSEIVIPNGVTSISSEAFYSCTNLTRVLCPSSISSIDSGAFLACPMLESVVIDKRDESILIGPRAFSENTSVVMKPEEGFAFAGWNDSNGNRVDLQGITSGYVSVWPSWKAEVLIYDISAKQRYPWNGLVDITCRVAGIVGETNGLKLAVAAVMPDNNIVRNLSHVWLVQDGTNSSDREVHVNGNYRLLWDARADLGTVRYTNMVVRVSFDEHDKVQLWEGGPYWATTNIGADEPWESGYYFWWGDTVGYKRENNAWVAADRSSSNFSFESGNTPTYNKSISTLQNEGWVVSQDGTYVLAPEHDAAQVQRGGEWRMSTYQEMYDLCYNKCDWSWTTQNGVKVYVVRGRGDYAGNSIIIPCAGLGSGTLLRYDGSCGYAWSSVNGSDSYRACALGLESDGPGISNRSIRYFGMSVRPVQGFKEGNSRCDPNTGDCVPFILDTTEGMHIVQEGESIPVAYSPHWNGAANSTVAETGGCVLVEAATNEGSVVWLPYGVGLHTLTHTAGDTVYTAQFTVLGEDILIHIGTLSSNEVWSADKVHLVTSAVTVPSGVSLTIEPGAVVKFMSGTSLTVASGGSCTARGVIFTHVNDDTVGGDTLYDGEETQPIMGELTISGSIVDDDTTEYRYMPPQTLECSITSDTRLRGYSTYIASNSVAVASGATLSLLPGTVIKFNSGCSLTVNGTLDAQGTRAAPIVFTSLKDDDHGGDTNGDGDLTSPYYNDWKYVIVSGTANLKYVTMMYGGGASNSSESGMLIGQSGGIISLDGCILAHALYDGIFSRATVNGENTIIYDCDRGINTCGGSGVFKNCVIDLCRWGVMAEGGSGTYYNCIISRFYGSTSWPTGWGVAYWSGSLKTYNCCVWSTLPGASNYRSSPTAVNNIIADPLFEDMDNMDFRIKEGSPCIDAGNGTQACANDYYGQPRMDVKSVKDTGYPNEDGVCPDIGIYEFPGVPSVPSPDLAVLDVSVSMSDGSVKPGDVITVTYVVTNRGSVTATGTARDMLQFKGADSAVGGITAEVPEVGQMYSLASGASMVMSARIVVPAIKAGSWNMCVVANAERDIFEQNLSNNSATADEIVEVELEAMSSGSHSVTVKPGEPSSFIVAGIPFSGGTVRVAGANAGGITALGGNGVMPTVGDSNSCMTIPLADGSLIVVFPARVEGENAYLVLENGGSAAVTVSVEVKECELALYGATPGRIANVDEATITITGSGFDSGMTVTLGGRTAKSVDVLNAAQVAATFDVEGMAAGAYDITASTSGAAGPANLKNAVEVYAAKMGPKLRAWLEMPSSVRDGRVFTGYVCYANEGDSPMTMPVFKVAREDSNTKMGLVASESMTETTLYVGGISPTHPAGVLKAGDEARIPFYFQPFGTYKIKLTHIKDVEDMAEYPTFGGTREYLAAMGMAATRLNLRGRTVYSLTDFMEQALREKNGVACAAVSGYLVDVKTGEPIANTGISLVAADSESQLAPTTGRTDERGYFQLPNLADGEYRWLMDSGMTLADVSTNTLTIAGQADINGVSVSATLGGRISGHVLDTEGRPVAGGTLVLYNGTETSVAATAVANSFGYYEFIGLVDGDWTVRAQSQGILCSDIATNLVIGVAVRDVSVDFGLKAGARLSGDVKFGGEPATNGTVQAITTDGVSYECPVELDGTWSLDGLPSGTYDVRHYSSTALSPDLEVTLAVGDDLTLELVSKPRPIFFPTRSVGFGSLETSFLYLDSDRAAAAIAWEWDFDSDGTIDSTVAQPTWTYSELGTNTVTLVMTEADGTRITSVYVDCVRIEKPVETVLKDNAILFGTNSGTLEAVEKGEGVLVLSGEPESGTLTVGMVLMGQCNEEWFCRRIKSVAKESEQWVLTTELADWSDIYEQVGMSFYVPLDLDENPSSTPTVRASRTKAASRGKNELLVQGGLRGGVNVSPKIGFEAVQEMRNGRKYERWALKGSLSLEAWYSLEGSVTYTHNFKESVESPPVPLPAGFSLHSTAGIYANGSASLRGSLKRSTIGGTVSICLGRESYEGEKGHWLPPGSIEPIRSEPEGEVEGSLGIEFGYQLGVKVKFLETASVGLDVDPYAKLNISASSSAPVTLDVGVGCKLHAEVNLIDWSFGWFKVKVGVEGDVADISASLLKLTGADPDFTYSPLSCLSAPARYDFINQSKGAHFQGPIWDFSEAPRRYDWDFGDGSKSSDVNPNHTYQDKGTYTVSLKAYGDFITGPYRKKKTIQVGEKDDDGDEETDDTEQDTGKKSWDPNEMVGDDGVGETRLVRPGQELTYTIYFENKEGFDIADAQEVKVTNQLSEWLDWSTFEMREVAFNNQNDNGLFGLASGTNDVKMTGVDRYVRVAVGGGDDGADAIAAKGVAHWYLRVYDPNGNFGWPADGSGFLPSNDDTHRGEGHITYRIKVREDAPANVVITNSASIVFDYNDPIETDPAWWNTVAPTIGTAKFAGAEVSAEEGSDIVVRVNGGNLYTDSSVKLYLAYNTAAAADLDLAKGAIDDVTPKGGLKFPLTISWEAGEIGEKVVTIPIKADKTVEDYEFFTLQLAAPVGMELGDARVCTVTIRDPGYYDLEAKIASGTATKAEQTAWDKLKKAKAPYVLGLADPAEAGKVAGSGLCAAGKKVTLKATANKGFVFNGWYDGDTLLSQAASYTPDMPETDKTLYAKFITAEEDRASITLSLSGMDLDSPSVAPTALETNITCGVALEWQLAAGALSATTIKVAGLPAGLKFAAKDVVDPKTKHVTVKANTIYGAPTAASKAGKDGKPTPSEVKITVTTSGKSSVTYLVKLTVDPLPEWAVGTFDGDVESGGIVQAFTVATSGKISGKILEGGRTWTLSAASFDMVEDSSFYATVICKAGKEVVTNEVEVAGTVVKGVEVGVASSDGWSAWQNLWKRADTKAEMPVFKKSFDVTLESGLKLTFRKNGAVSFAGKVEGVSVSGSSQLVCDGDAWKVTLYAPPKGAFKGFSETFAVTLAVDEAYAVTGVEVAEWQ